MLKILAIYTLLFLACCEEKERSKDEELLLDAANMQVHLLNDIYKNIRGEYENKELLIGNMQKLRLAINHLREAKIAYQKIKVDGFLASLFGGKLGNHNNILLSLLTKSSLEDLNSVENDIVLSIEYYSATLTDEMPVGTYVCRSFRNNLYKLFSYVGVSKDIVNKVVFDRKIEEYENELQFLTEKTKK